MNKLTVSICIPTFNGEKYLKEVLFNIFRQKTKFKYEVIIIDSGSTDKTLEIIKKFPIKLIQIPNKEFQHGRTRNFLIQRSKGNYVVFLTQDATPTNKDWLNQLIKPFKLNPKIVAVYSRHLVRKDAPPFIKRDTDGLFLSITNNDQPCLQFKEKKKYTDFEIGRLNFFSDVNCALKKSYVLINPYQTVDYAEDQLMGKEIINSGMIKVYNPKAQVFHSHKYPINQYLFRYFDEYTGLKNTLDYIDQITIKRLIPETFESWLLDTRFIIKNKNETPKSKIYWTFNSFFYNFYRFSAALLVKYSSSLSPQVKNYLSMEYKMKHKNNKNIISNKIKNKLNKLLYVQSNYGFKGSFKLVNGFIKKIIGKKQNFSSIDSDKHFMYEFISKSIETTDDQPKKTIIKNKIPIINWIIPDFGIGSGGHTTIFRIIKYLENKGYKNNIYMFGPLAYDNAKIIKETINTHFFKLNADVFINTKNMNDSDATFATSWHTAYSLKNINNTRHKFYLVQDFEPSFYPMSSEYIFAENTYKFGFNHICASKWLSDLIKEKYNSKASFFNLGYDENSYFTDDKIKKNKNTIVFYGRWPTPRRGFDLGILSLSEIYKQNPLVKIKVFGWQEENKLIPFPYQNLGILTPKQLGDLYRKSTLGLSISLTNLSLIPAEMIACGLPVVEVNHPSLINLYQSNKEIILSEKTPESISQNIISLLNDSKKRQTLANNATNKLHQEYGWNKNLEKIEKEINRIINK